jgi:hypothetical protein
MTARGRDLSGSEPLEQWFQLFWHNSRVIPSTRRGGDDDGGSGGCEYA